ncbi:unnamed protein product [Peniophora sp. CBMAI 1063]|nr:unnamed protein product [Peniophora sp. CBMAI 1063]
MSSRATLSMCADGAGPSTSSSVPATGSVPSDATSSSSSGSGSDLIHDEKFYMQTVIFLAGRTLFKPPVYALPKEDGIFSSMFALPNSTGEGSADDNPIRLPPDIAAEDFRCFLEACIPKPDWEKPSKMSVEAWMRVLKLATMWNLESLRAKAITSASNELTASGESSIIDKIVLGKQYSVSRWLLEGYEALAKRDARLTPGERDQLGPESASRVWDLREESFAWFRKQVKAWPSRAKDPYDDAWNGIPTWETHAFDFRGAVRRIFEDELGGCPDYDASSAAGDGWEYAAWPGRVGGRKRARVDGDVTGAGWGAPAHGGWATPGQGEHGGW